MQDEIHLVSMIIMARPAQMDALSAAIEQIEGSEIHVRHPDGKFVVTAEANDPRTLMTRIEALQAMDGVVSSNLVYHQVA